MHVPHIINLLGPGWERYDVGAMGEFDVYLLLEQYAGERTASRFAPKWRGGYYYAAHKQGSTAPAGVAETATVDVFYVSRWASAQDAQDFAAEYAKGLAKRYSSVTPVADGNSGRTTRWRTEEGEVVIEPAGELVLVTESFDAELGAKLRAAAVAAEAGVLMASPSETTLIVLGSATAAQLVSPETAGFWQIVTAIGLTVTPLLAKVGRLAGRRVSGQELTSQMDSSLDDAELGQVVILGFGRVGRMVADLLETHGKDYLGIDSDSDAVAASRKEGYDIFFGDVAHPELIGRLRDRQPSALILTMDNPVLVNRLARRLRRTFPDLPIIARARDTAHAAELYKAGVTDAVPETLEASLQLSEAALVDLGVPMGPVIASIHEKRDELRAEIKTEAEMEETPRLGRRRLRDV